MHCLRPSLGFLLLAASLTGAQPQTRPATQPVTEGFVIYEGQYLAPPYVLTWDNGLLTINDLPMQSPRPNRPNRRPAGGSGRRAPIHMPPVRAAAWVERRLAQGALLICWADQPSVFITGEPVREVLAILTGGDDEAVQAERLKQSGPQWITRHQWTELIQQFSKSAALEDRLSIPAPLETVPAPDDEEDWYNDSLIAGFTISGFALAVLALGLLLKSRYPNPAPDHPGASRQVIELVLLLVALNAYDLVCTLFAHAMGGLWELNPFAGSMMDEGLLVILYKAGLTVGAALLLIVARRHRLAQLAAYWTTVLYTVLILRWITYNAMFIV